MPISPFPTHARHVRLPLPKVAGLSKFFLATVSLICLLSLSFRSAPLSLEGTWRDHEGGGVIRIYQQAGKYHGQLIAADDPEEQQMITGKRIMILEGFEQQTTGELCCGTIFLARMNRHVSGTLSLVNDSTLLLTGRWGPFSKSRTWKRM